MSPDRGGFTCPVSWCDHREFIQSLLDQHIRLCHPEETP
jgi:hypothetical protein